MNSKRRDTNLLGNLICVPVLGFRKLLVVKVELFVSLFRLVPLPGMIHTLEVGL